jgi:4-hydroxybenzoate polyprenyltransferase
MRPKFDTSGLGETQWHEYAIRFLFGGGITVAAGLVASKFGPTVGGLLLAFPAILPASATLIEKHEKERKEEKGLNGATRGRQAASLDAAGAAMGSVALLVFALLVWQLLPDHRAWIVLPGAMVAWLVVSVSIWVIRERMRTIRRKSRSPGIGR